jgi:phosphate transport system permease protein
VKKIESEATPRFYLLSTFWQGNGQEEVASFATLEEAISEVERLNFIRSADKSSAVSSPRLAIVCKVPGQPEKIQSRPRYRFYVNVRSNGEGGEGTEVSPWWGVPEAVLELQRLNKFSQIKLKAGQSLHLSHREVFTATSLEKRKKIKETSAKYFLMLMSLMLVSPVLTILGFIVYKAWPALSLSFLLTNPTNYMTAGGIWAPLVGTFFLVFFSLLAAAPVGILAGVYLNEYARENWFTRTINLAVMNLAGVPSIVHALFGVGAFVLFAGMGRSMLAASLTLAVMTLPVIITSTREALASVPVSFREACWNLGATRWQTIRTIVLPNSISGILTGVILQVARAAGETAPILFTGAVFFMPVPDHGLESFFPYSLGDRCMALSMHLYTLVTQVRGAPEPLYYGTALVLIGLVLAVNSASIGLRSYLRSRKKW